MKLNLRAICFASSLAVVMSLATAAQANTFTGAVYATPAYPAPLAPHGPGGPVLETFTVSNINFFSAGGPSYTVNGFLNSGGALLSATDVVAGTGASTLDNKALEITGTAFLAAGTYTITHDDGMFLYLNGSSTCAICSGAPTSPAPSTFTIATAGNYSFDLWYAEVNGAPATLNGAGVFNNSPVPEPSSIVLLGSGLISAAGLIRRRLAR